MAEALGKVSFRGDRSILEKAAISLRESGLLP
jgi:hypothetical protein